MANSLERNNCCTTCAAPSHTCHRIKKCQTAAPLYQKKKKEKKKKDSIATQSIFKKVAFFRSQRKTSKRLLRLTLVIWVEDSPVFLHDATVSNPSKHRILITETNGKILKVRHAINDDTDVIADTTHNHHSEIRRKKVLENIF
ncbi:hypothetical protein C0J52_08997 [Blattella germanica]|nr:hypothetical protein C0J52_08997 [Blattella germanica]